MIIVEDERTKTFKVRMCENCKKMAPAREVFAVGHVSGDRRGAYVLCFACDGPKIRWKRTYDGKVIESPARQ